MVDDERAEPRYVCCHGDEDWCSLGEAARSIAVGKHESRPASRGGASNALLALWLKRLLWEAGLFDPVDIPFVGPPTDPRSTVQLAYEGLFLWFGLGWAGVRAGSPLACSAREFGAWCGVSKSQANRLLRGFVTAGIMERVGERPSENGRPGTPLYLPGGWPATCAPGAREVGR
ncbi:MAG: hypothetical protein JHC84_02065 [Solirubrobacteraceae bacterium]|nr:hypothetical protein [Solirubrobacteraceae bacterium]